MPGLEAGLPPDGPAEAAASFAREKTQANGSQGETGIESLALPGGRVELDPKTVQHDLARLVLCLVEVVRQLMERQALRRVEGGSLTASQIEALGLTLMRLEERMDELKDHFGVTGEELQLDLSGLIEDI
jgi:hypothetical protein